MRNGRRVAIIYHQAGISPDHLGGRTSLRDRYRDAPTFETMLATVTKNVELWTAMWRHARVDEDYVRRVSSLPGRWHLLVLSEDWCGDAVNTVPIVAKLVERCPNVDMRVLARDANPDLMDAHLTGGSRSIPVIIVLDEAYEERALVGAAAHRAAALGLGAGTVAGEDGALSRARTWYARDRGRTTLDEVVSMLERAASTSVAAG
jgi:hypothetical protein